MKLTTGKLQEIASRLRYFSGEDGNYELCQALDLKDWPTEWETLMREEFTDDIIAMVDQTDKKMSMFDILAKYLDIAATHSNSEEELFLHLVVGLASIKKSIEVSLKMNGFRNNLGDLLDHIVGDDDN